MNKNDDQNNLHNQRQLEAQKLDDLAEKYFMAACAGDIKAAEFLLDISERRSKLLGLDAPIQTQMEVITYDATELQRQYEILSRISDRSL